jgi:pimeloyl-ACP methyl ester carboxylesterase
MLANQKPQLHFVHGNSFPAGTYRALLDHLSQYYEIGALDIHGHDPQYPVTNNWPYLVQELLDTLKKRYQEPVILVGHSMGGMLSFMLASRFPELVCGVVMIDSPVVAGWRALIVRIFKKFNIGQQYSPARFSEKRKNQWESKEAAYRHFSAKEIFAIWPPTVLQDYIDAGIVAQGGTVTLRFRREIETQIYLTLPDTLGKIVRRGMHVPLGFVGGIDSIECRQAGLKATRKMVRQHFIQIPGGHLIPMECPEQTAQAVHNMILSFNLGTSK